MNAPKSARLNLFFERFRAAEAATSRGEALDLLAAILNEVENEMTSIPFNPLTWETDGRLYPPQADSIRDVPNFPDVKRYRTSGHNTFISQNGAIEITVPPPSDGGRSVFSKNGSDGNGVQRQ